MVAGEEVDRAAGRVTERVGDRRHGGGERRAGRHAGFYRANCPYRRSANSCREAVATMDAMATPSPKQQVVEALRPVQDPELHRSIVDLGMLRGVDIRRQRHRRRAHRPHRPRVPAARTRSNDRVSRRGDRARRRRVDRPRVHGDDRRASARNCARASTATPAATAGQARGPRPRRGSRDPVRPERLEDPAAADLVGQGRRRQVERHDQPRRRARPAGVLGRRGRCRHLRLLDPPHARCRSRSHA